MNRENKILKNIIVLLTVIIVLLVGFSIFFIMEFHDEKQEIKKLYDRDIDTTFDSSSYDRDEEYDEIDNESEKYITRDKALDISLDDAKLQESDVYDVGVELDYKYGEVVYEVDFNYQNYEYEYFINAKSGKIIKSFKEIDR